MGQFSVKVGNEVRLHFRANWIQSFEPLQYSKKTTNRHRRSVVFLERVTRLELATSTLARWRSTG